MNSARTAAYLQRIGVDRPASALPPTEETLRDLHLAHLRGVPFENLSIHLGEDIVLSEEALTAKIVDRRRGGFCYELNGAFAALLAALGFEVTLLQARVCGKDGKPGIPYDHLALAVRLHGGRRLLADVGFGSHSHHPLSLDMPGAEQHDPGGVFVLTESAEGDLRVDKDGTPEYVMEQRPRVLADFRAGAWYHRTSPESHFTSSLVCSLTTRDGRITLSGSTLTRTAGEQVTRSELATDGEVLDAYRRHFGIKLDRVPAVGRTFRS